MNHNADLLADLDTDLDTGLDTGLNHNEDGLEYGDYAECAFCTTGLEFMICHEKLYADKSKTKLINGKVFHKVEWVRNTTTINPKTEISNNIYSNITNGGTNSNNKSNIMAKQTQKSILNIDIYASQDECKEAKITFMDYAKYKAYYHVLDSWLDIDRELIKTYKSPSNTTVDPTKYVDPDGKYSELLAELKPEFYKQTKTGVRNSLYYMFYKYGSGAYYVRIREGKLQVFCYLWNDGWENPLAEYLEVDPKFARKYAKSNKSKWSVLGAMVRVYEKKYEGYAMDFYYSETKYLILRLCEVYKMPDCDFIVANKDNMAIKGDLSEACEELVGAHDIPLQSQYKFREYCPIFSFSWNARYADLPLPTPDDVLRTFRLYPAEKCKNLYIDLPNIQWAEKKATAVFRGSFTGNSANVNRNPRLHVAMLNSKWKFDTKYNEKNPIDGVRYLDAGLSSKGGYTRGRKEMTDKYIRFVDNNYWNHLLVDPLSHEQQMGYKYVLYIEGNAAAYRGAFLFAMGSVVLWVKSPKYHLWFEPYLQDRINCVFVKFDLSDLADRIEWLKQNDDAAKKIADAGRVLYDKLLTKDAILAFAYQSICNAL